MVGKRPGAARNYASKTFNPLGIPHIRVHTSYPTSEAIIRHPDLIPFLKTRHPPRIDRENRELLFKYNHYICQDLFGLDIDFSKTGIIPTPVLRYNFLKYALMPRGEDSADSADLYDSYDSKAFKEEKSHTGLQNNPFPIPANPDNLNNPNTPNTPNTPNKPNNIYSLLEIGTGASAIMALMAAKFFQCRVYATEIDCDYLEIAQRNINRNNLREKITLLPSSGGIIDSVVPRGQDLQFDFIISNPPYYDKILSPKNIWGGKTHELISEGEAGELFIINMIREGWKFLTPGGRIAFIIPKTRTATLLAVEEFLNENEYDYDILALLVGNRTRYVFRIFKEAYRIDEQHYTVSEMND